MFIEVFIIIARTQRQPRCPQIMNSGCQQINEQWYIQSMEYLALKKKDDKTTRRHGRTLDAYNYAKQTNPRKARDCVISTI